MIFCRAAVALFFIFLSCQSFAQTFNVVGRVVDQNDKTPLVGLTVSLTPNGSNIPTAGSVTDSTGAFSITSIPVNTYTLRTTYVGYKDFQKVITGSTGNIELIITMEKDVTQLANVIIEETPPPATQKGD